MAHREPSPTPTVRTSVEHGLPADLAGYAQEKISKLGRFAHGAVLDARVRLTRQPPPRSVLAQGNLDVNGRRIRAQVSAADPREAVDQLESRLRAQLARLDKGWEAHRLHAHEHLPGHWRHDTPPDHRPPYFRRPAGERRIVRHKSFTLATNTIDEAAEDMLLLDHDFHLFTETGTGQDSVLYHAGPTGHRLAQTTSVAADGLSPHRLPVTLSRQPAPLLSTGEAADRLALTGMPFQFFLDAERGRGAVLYHRYDGHYGLISPAV